MMQSRTHNCNQLRIENVGEKVKLVGWMENVREVGGNLAFVVLRDFYGTKAKTIPKLWPKLHQRSKPFAMPPFRRGIQKMRSKP